MGNYPSTTVCDLGKMTNSNWTSHQQGSSFDHCPHRTLQPGSSDVTWVPLTKHSPQDFNLWAGDVRIGKQLRCQWLEQHPLQHQETLLGVGSNRPKRMTLKKKEPSHPVHSLHPSSKYLSAPTKSADFSSISWVALTSQNQQVSLKPWNCCPKLFVKTQIFHTILV